MIEKLLTDVVECIVYSTYVYLDYDDGYQSAIEQLFKVMLRVLGNIWADSVASVTRICVLSKF